MSHTANDFAIPPILRTAEGRATFNALRPVFTADHQLVGVLPGRPASTPPEAACMVSIDPDDDADPSEADTIPPTDAGNIEAAEG